MSTRPNLFEEDDDLDLSAFAPRPEAALNAPSAEQVHTVTEAAPGGPHSLTAASRLRPSPPSMLSPISRTGPWVLRLKTRSQR